MILSLIQEAKYFKIGAMHGIDDLAICHRLGVPGVPKPPKIAMVVRWLPPPPGCYKLNVDGSSENGHIYACCVIRNSLGFFVTAFSVCLGTGIALDAEVLAGMHGVIFAKARGWNSLWLETDSVLAKKILTVDGKLIQWRIRPAWRRYEESRRQVTLQVSHIHREGNAIADMLAKLHIDRVWIGGCPKFLIDKLFADMNTEYFRVN